jgi:prophage regulatory protein
MKHPTDISTAAMGNRRIRKPEVLKLTGYKNRTLYRRIAAGLFPAPIKDGRMSFWWLSEVQKCLGVKSLDGGQFI